jgi:hypothetical protein
MGMGMGMDMGMGMARNFMNFNAIFASNGPNSRVANPTNFNKNVQLSFGMFGNNVVFVPRSGGGGGGGTRRRRKLAKHSNKRKDFVKKFVPVNTAKGIQERK